MLAATGTAERFEAIARRHCQFGQIPYAIQLREFSGKDTPECLRTRSSRPSAVEAVEEVFGRRIREGAYHAMYYNEYRYKLQPQFDTLTLSSKPG